jgi:tRNA-(MS[2]IO[6]A)-hydroxylase (MiaE)-like
MPVDFGIARWTRDVAARQWPRDDGELVAIGEAIPAEIAASRALSEVHRLDLCLFVVFEEAALRVSGALTRHAPTAATLAFAAQQSLDEARHHEVFLRRLTASVRASGASARVEDIVVPPLRRFLDHCYEVADRGTFVEGLVLMNLVLEGMAHPLYAYEQRYWQPADPYLTRLIASAFADETRHVAMGAATVRGFLDADPGVRARCQRLADDGRRLMGEVFDYYIRKFVGLFDAVARRHQALFAGACFEPGRLVAETPYAEQVSAIRARIDEEHRRLLRRAGLAA